MNIEVNRIDHIGIAVKSIEDSMKLYSGLLNLKKEGVEELEERGLRVHIFRVGETKFELLEPTREDSEISKFLEKKGEGIHHIALNVDDIETTFEKAKDMGFRIIGDAIQRGAGGRRIFFLHPKDTGGILIEFVEGGRENE